MELKNEIRSQYKSTFALAKEPEPLWKSGKWHSGMIQQTVAEHYIMEPKPVGEGFQQFFISELSSHRVRRPLFLLRLIVNFISLKKMILDIVQSHL